MNASSGTAVFRENFVAICTHDRRLWIRIWMANFIFTASLGICDQTAADSDVFIIDSLYELTKTISKDTIGVADHRGPR